MSHDDTHMFVFSFDLHNFLSNKKKYKKKIILTENYAFVKSVGCQSSSKEGYHCERFDNCSYFRQG